MSRNMPKSSAVGRTAPRLAHETSLTAAAVCGSVVCSTACVARSKACRRSTTAASRCLQNGPTPWPHCRSLDTMASPSALCAAVTAGVTRAPRAIVTSEMFTDAKPKPFVMRAKANVRARSPNRPMQRLAGVLAMHGRQPMERRARRDRWPRQQSERAFRRSVAPRPREPSVLPSPRRRRGRRQRS